MFRAFSSSALRRLSAPSQEQVAAYRRKRKSEWKRRQGGHSFLDHLIVTLRGGKGGDGCAAFHREKFKPFGPPSGGNGGRGGSIYFLPTPELTTLSTIPGRIRGHKGEHGKGTWQNGKAGEPLVVRVPLGTVVRELARDDSRRAKDEWENEEESIAADGLSTSERVERMREKRWVHYPGYADSNIQRDDFKEAEHSMYKLERERRLTRRQRLDQHPILLDLSRCEDPYTPSSTAEADNAPLGIRQPEYLGHLIAQGGLGGLGNPHFVTTSNRTPRYATRGHEGERTTLSLELKLLADIGLIGLPNAGKSTLLRALTGGRAKTEVAGYAFTTLNPVIGIIRVAKNGVYEGELASEGTIYGETKIEEQAFEEKMRKGEFANFLTRNQTPSPGISISSADTDPHLTSEPTRPGHHFDIYESFRFTIADNPGLIENSASPLAHAGLGHSFLRAIERSSALVCVVDFSVDSPSDSVPETSQAELIPTTDGTTDSPEETDHPTLNVDPYRAIKILKTELEKYQQGMSSNIKLVLANKADLIATPSSTTSTTATSPAIDAAKKRLRAFEKYIQKELGMGVAVIPVSAKYGMNLRKVVAYMSSYVERRRALTHSRQKGDK